MIRELKLENFRAFRELSLIGLGRVNLLVGANNSGKTSVLEAVAFLASGGDPWELYRSLFNRREQASVEMQVRSSPEDAVDVRHLFFGRQIGDDTSLKIDAVDAGGAAIELRLSTPRVPSDKLAAWRLATAQSPRRVVRRVDARFVEIDRIPRYLRIDSLGAGPIDVALLLNGGLTQANATLAGFEPDNPVAFVPASGINDDDLATLYEKIVMTNEEANVVAALQGIESGIVRIATRQRDSFSDRGFVVGMEGAAEPVPLGGLGDGVHRLLAIALSLVTAQGGYLLVDEIDTGLHHTVMQQMWRLVFETAKRLDITVFATTHSYDCVHALAAIARPDIRDGGEVSLIRVERDKPQAIHFTEEEISHLAEWQIEAR